MVGTIGELKANTPSTDTRDKHFLLERKALNMTRKTVQTSKRKKKNRTPKHPWHAPKSVAQPGTDGRRCSIWCQPPSW